VQDSRQTSYVSAHGSDPVLLSSVCRACRIKNQPLPNKQLLLEEDLLPLLPVNSSTGSMSVTQMQVCCQLAALSTPSHEICPVADHSILLTCESEAWVSSIGGC
jgi:hypothetical protein